VIKHRLRWKAAREQTHAGLAAAITAATLALASTAFVGAPAASASISTTASRPAPVKIPAQLTQGIHTVLDFLDPTTGLLEDTNWHQAVAMSAAETYQQTTGDNTFDAVFNNSHLKNAGVSEFENSLDDDTAWWGLAWLQGYQIAPHDRLYLQNAEDIANYIYNGGWDNSCGGGVWWQRAHTVLGFIHVPHKAKNAIANELFLELTAWLASTYEAIPGDTALATKYLNEAEAEWEWFQEVGMISNGTSIPNGKAKPIAMSKNLVTDGITNLHPQYNKGACNDGGTTNDLFTYDQGVILAGLAELYKAALNDPKDTKYRAQAPGYLTQAENIVKAVLNPNDKFEMRVGKKLMTTTFTTANGVLTEPGCNSSLPCGTGDEAEFKGIFVRDLRMLDDVIASAPKYNSGSACTDLYDHTNYTQCTTMYDRFFTTQATSIYAHDTDTMEVGKFGYTTWFGMFWQGPSVPTALDTQVSALEALVSALNLPTPSPS
jgi:predicted alpha-1,6-mannanase (GH76 family)